MKWLLILSLWNTNPPQDSFKFFTKVFDSKEECDDTLQDSYIMAFNKGVQAQAVCISSEELGMSLGSSY